MKYLTLSSFLILLSLTTLMAQKSELNNELASQIDAMRDEDQKYRNALSELSNQGNADKEEMAKTLKKCREVDSLNQIQVKQIFEKYGYPGNDLIGEKSAHNFWLLVQHCDTDPEFQEKVLDAMEKEVKKKNADPSDYAYLRDRVCVNLDKPQVYGTQMRVNADSTSFEPLPLIEPKKVNKRRKKMGMGKIERYIKTMNEYYFGSLKNKK